MKTDLKNRIADLLNKNNTEEIDSICTELREEQRNLTEQLDKLTEFGQREYVFRRHNQIETLGKSLYRFKQLSENGLSKEAYQEAQNISRLLSEFAGTVVYKWVAEPNACDRCRSLNGMTYYSPDDIPEKPHPNCKCRLEITTQNASQTFYVNASVYEDKTQATRDEINKMKVEIEKLEQKAEENLKEVEKQEKLIKDIENKIDVNTLPPEEKRQFDEVKRATIAHKENILKIKKQNNIFFNIIDDVITTKNYYKRSIQDGIKSLFKDCQYKAEQYLIHKAPKYQIDILGHLYSIKTDMPEAWQAYKIASINYKNNTEYLQKNANVYDTIKNINDEKLEKEIQERLFTETQKTDCKVVVFKPDSSMAHAVMNDLDFIAFLRDNIYEIKKNRTIPNKKIEFTQGDMYNVLHGAMVKDVKLHDDNTLTMRIEDLYNFNPNRTSARGQIGERLQNTGELENYYIIIKIKIKMF